MVFFQLTATLSMLLIFALFLFRRLLLVLSVSMLLHLSLPYFLEKYLSFSVCFCYPITIPLVYFPTIFSISSTNAFSLNHYRDNQKNLTRLKMTYQVRPCVRRKFPNFSFSRVSEMFGFRSSEFFRK
jgi:hypothetical protein